MDLISAVDAGIKLSELGLKLAEVIERAKGPRVELNVLLYLQAAQAAIHALGRERQAILSDACGCDIQDREQVEALSQRMRTYLQEDNVRYPLKKAIKGLAGCRKDIEHAAQGIKWRKRDKLAAVEAFVATIDVLRGHAQDLAEDFFPEYSGSGLGTLVPVYELICQVRDIIRRGRELDVETDEEKLGELVKDALRDPAHDRWIQKAADVERLIVELRLAFSVREN